MFSLKSTLVLGVMLASLATPFVINGNAAAANGSCTLEAVQPNIGQPIEGRKFTTKGNRIYIKVVVKGTDCAKVVTLESWKAPNPDLGKPYSEQILFRHFTTNPLGAGSHLLSIQLPNCFYQVDLIHGSKTMGANGEIKFDATKVIGSAHGGTQKCTQATPETPDTPEEPETPVTPTPSTPTPTTQTASSQVTSLPKTGAGSIVVGAFSGMTALGTAAHYFVRRKLLGV
ncbi:MAG: hypothetical protein JWN82_605 [Candidatus Saccharibacteria bacterium]|nr:hypothetical protein [Candidatus Saccharibacteria bacterium]